MVYLQQTLGSDIRMFSRNHNDIVIIIQSVCLSVCLDWSVAKLSVCLDWSETKLSVCLSRPVCSEVVCLSRLV